MRLHSLFAAATGAALLAVAPAAAYDRLYVFGDSLVDSGNARALSPADVPPVAIPPSPGNPGSAGYPSGRFTNGIDGRNFADDVSRALGFGDATPFLNPGGLPGTNFAVGGATVGYSPTETRVDLLTEIQGPPVDGKGNPIPRAYPANYLAAANAHLVQPIDANSLILVAAGGNDIRGIVGSGADPATFVANVAAQLGRSLQALYNDGARNFVVVGLPDIGLLPGVYGTSLAAGATLLTNALDQAYGAVATDLAAKVGGQGIVRLVDIASLQNAITDDPAAYGITPGNEHRSCYFDGGDAAVASGCAGYLYYDRIHPTAAIHRQIAAAVLAALPEPAGWATMILGFAFVGTALRRARCAAPSARRA